MVDFRKMTEKYSSQLRAVFQLAKMGWLPISRAEVRLHKEITKKLEERNKGLAQKLLSGEIDLTGFNL